MRYEIVLTPEAVENLRKLSAHDVATIRDAMELHLRFEPTKESKSRIKRLQIAPAQYRLASMSTVSITMLRQDRSGFWL